MLLDFPSILDNRMHKRSSFVGSIHYHNDHIHMDSHLANFSLDHLRNQQGNSSNKANYHYCDREVSAWVNSVYRIIATIREHIRPSESLAGAGVVVGVDEAVVCRVIIARLQIIEAGFGIVVIATAVRRVERCKIRGQSGDRSISCTLRQLQYRPLIVRKFDYVCIFVQHPLYISASPIIQHNP